MRSVHPHVRGADGRACAWWASSWPVHPHVRGADGGFRSAMCHLSGSSPRAWGRFFHNSPIVLLPRFIPTCVGQIRAWQQNINNEIGSSPRAWGRWDSVPPPFRSASVHPHVRGADSQLKGRSEDEYGFIPTCVGQMLCECDAGHQCQRFIPTCVGQIDCCGGYACDKAVHPHVRGADLFKPFCRTRTFGSSPRAWGRFASAVMLNASMAVHPHVRGADVDRSKPA